MHIHIYVYLHIFTLCNHTLNTRTCRPRVSTQIDAGLVVVILLTLVSAMQYYLFNNSFAHQIKSILDADEKLVQKVSEC